MSNPSIPKHVRYVRYTMNLTSLGTQHGKLRPRQWGFFSTSTMFKTGISSVNYLVKNTNHAFMLYNRFLKKTTFFTFAMMLKSKIIFQLINSWYICWYTASHAFSEKIKNKKCRSIALISTAGYRFFVSVRASNLIRNGQHVSCSDRPYSGVDKAMGSN